MNDVSDIYAPNSIAIEIFGGDYIDVKFKHYNTFRVRVVDIALSWYVERYGDVFVYEQFSAIKANYDVSPHTINKHLVEHIITNVTKYVPNSIVETIELHSKGMHCHVDINKGYEADAAFYKSDLC